MPPIHHSSSFQLLAQELAPVADPLSSWTTTTGDEPLKTEDRFLIHPEILRYVWGRPELLAELGGISGVAAGLRTNLISGLPAREEGQEEEELRRSVFGSNTYPKPRVTKFWEHCWEAVQDPMLVILCIAGVLSIILGLVEDPRSGWIEGSAILITVVVVTFVTAGNELQQEKQFRILEEEQSGERVSVIRGGSLRTILDTEILVGDLLQLAAGDDIPADGIVVPFSGDPVKVNASQLTGESDDLTKTGTFLYTLTDGCGEEGKEHSQNHQNHQNDQNDQNQRQKDEFTLTGDPFLSAGTDLKEGSCGMLVVAVGTSTVYGQIMASLGEKTEATPLQRRLEKVASLVGYVGGGVAILLFLALLVGWVIRIESDSELTYRGEAGEILDFFVMAVTIVVVAVPEGLPLAVTVSLAYSMRQMLTDRVLVRHLSACETMGNATTICSDKTGTLTLNRMSVVQAWFAGQHFLHGPPTILSSAHSSRDSGGGGGGGGDGEGGKCLGERLRRCLVQSIALNSQARWDPEVEQGREVASPGVDSESDSEGGRRDLGPGSWVGGNSTERSLLDWQARHLGVDVEEERRSQPHERFFAFDSNKKNSSVILRLPLRDAGHQDPGVGWRMDTLTPEEETELRSSTAATVEETDVMIYRRAYKGAAEAILQNCTRYLDAEGRVLPLDAEVREEIRTAMEGMTKSGRRTIGMSFVDSLRDPCWEEIPSAGGGGMSGEDGKEEMEAMEAMEEKKKKKKKKTKMKNASRPRRGSLPWIQLKQAQLLNPGDRTDAVFLGLVGIRDPLRPDAYTAVRTCQKAGIVVRMVTGDHLETAKFIARDSGILTDEREQIAMLGSEFRRLYDHDREEELRALIPRLRVLARSLPQDKEKLVQWLRRNGEVVAVTGDGTNDSPALRAADVGLAMGIAGTAVCKKAADIVITDDKFSSIVKAVMWGRSVYDNIRKFVQFQLTVNVVALVISLVGAFSGYPNPLKPVQLLWVNLIMDTMAALALGTEKPDLRLLQRQPYRPDSSLFSPIMLRNILGQSVLQLGVLAVILFSDWFTLDQCPATDAEDPDPDVDCEEYGRRGILHYTLVFNTFVFLQFFNEINCRKVNAELNVLEKFFQNPIFLGVLGVTFLCQLLLVQVLGSFAQTRPLSFGQWILTIGIGGLSLPWGVCLRLIRMDPDAGRIPKAPEQFLGAHLEDPRYDDWNFKIAQDRHRYRDGEEDDVGGADGGLSTIPLSDPLSSSPSPSSSSAAAAGGAASTSSWLRRYLNPLQMLRRRRASVDLQQGLLGEETLDSSSLVELGSMAAPPPGTRGGRGPSPSGQEEGILDFLVEVHPARVTAAGYSADMGEEEEEEENVFLPLDSSTASTGFGQERLSVEVFPSDESVTERRRQQRRKKDKGGRRDASKSLLGDD